MFVKFVMCGNTFNMTEVFEVTEGQGNLSNSTNMDRPNAMRHPNFSVLLHVLPYNFLSD